MTNGRCVYGIVSVVCHMLVLDSEIKIDTAV